MIMYVQVKHGRCTPVQGVKHANPARLHLSLSGGEQSIHIGSTSWAELILAENLHTLPKIMKRLHQTSFGAAEGLIFLLDHWYFFPYSMGEPGRRQEGLEIPSKSLGKGSLNLAM